MDSSSCLDLALEGERLCKGGDFRAGVAFLEAAVNIGTDDTRVLSAIYSQLGNASFYLGDYDKALAYHQHDLNIAKRSGDLLGEAKASGNLGNTLKMMGKFDEAIMNCERHLSISREKGDKIGEARALYNLGNVYHAKGKHVARASQQDPGELPPDVRDCLQRAIQCYEKNLQLMVSLDDRSAQGRAYGNLGNTHYLLGNFTKAVTYHQQRLKLAKEFGDRAAQRRAYSNLGNAHIFLGEFELAAECYGKTCWLAQELGDRAVEAQACYSLGNTYTLLRDFERAIEYHLRHLRIAQELKDLVGEGKAYWSLGNAHCSLGNHKEALRYATQHLHVSKELGDQVGQATAQMSIADLKEAIQCSQADEADKPRRESMDQMNLLNMSGQAQRGAMVDDSDQHIRPRMDVPRPSRSAERSLATSMDQDAFFELLSEFQSKRMDDQRCSITPIDNKENILPNGPAHRASSSSSRPEDTASVREELLDLIVGMQSRRMDEQRTSLPQLPGLRRNNNNNSLHHRMSVGSVPEDDFFDMLIRCQGSRLEDQRSSMPTLQRAPSAPAGVSTSRSAPTVPDDDFFSLILRVQAGRIEDQRTHFQPPDVPNSTTNAVGGTTAPAPQRPPARSGLKGSLKSALRGSRHSKCKQ
ncbi:G-protein-signaling modulator 1-like [Ornithodoros turicata]|uniref:G-protein-signaling modulator 1-like n=1 Tax=Ornithodoros turicata TaxID=34597 RepID=UPI0031386328